MLLQIPDVLTAEQVAQARKSLDQADWIDGRITAGHQSAKAKDNLQLPAESPAARQVGAMILKALKHHEGNLSRAAESLGMSRPALYRRLEKYGIEA